MCDRLAAVLDGARAVKYDPDGFTLAWFGGESTGIHVYDLTGVERHYWQMEARRSGSYTAEDAEASMIAHAASGEPYP